jgi:H/ACA ribonucleoprotein complex subunit 3
MNLTVANRQISLSPNNIWKQGGEAEIYQLGNSALKVYKQPGHPHFITQQEREGAAARIQEHQTKLPAFPSNAPEGVIAPVELARDGNEKIAGYTMPLITNVEPLLRYSEKPYRKSGISNNDVLAVFRKLHKLVASTHNTGIVIGDFNDLNVLVNRDHAYLIDADSFQFGQFLCKMFTAIFVDPLLCDPKAKKLELSQPHNEASDWYAFAVMLMRWLLFVGPYGGVHRPRSASMKVTEPERPLHRLTVFDPDTRYPKPAMPLHALPDELLELLKQIFEKDRRGVFPEKQLEIRWTKCIKCGVEHARRTCPVCQQTAPTQKQTTVIRGKVKCVSVFQTAGQILHAENIGGKLHWLYVRGNQLYRNDNTKIVFDPPYHLCRWRLGVQKVWVGRGYFVYAADNKMAQRAIVVDRFDALSVFDHNSRHYYYAKNGSLMRSGCIGDEYIGDVLEHRTLFWVGEKFGFGFYQAGRMTVGFVFDAERQGINDGVKIPIIRGQLLDSTCFFTDSLCWFIASIEEGGQRFNRCVVINRKGEVIAQAEADHNGGTWLSTLRGKLAIGQSLLCATDDGIVRAEISRGGIHEVERYPDTATFVDTSCHLFPSRDGIYIVSEKEINLLSISK